LQTQKRRFAYQFQYGIVNHAENFGANIPIFCYFVFLLFIFKFAGSIKLFAQYSSLVLAFSHQIR
jgi:hypothetical protein